MKLVGKKTLESVNRKLGIILSEYKEVEKNAENELKVLDTKQEEIDRQKEFQQNQLEGAEIVSHNLSKILSEKL